MEKIINKLEESFSVEKYFEKSVLCGYELNTYTDAGVNQIIFLDFRDTDLNPENEGDFKKVFKDRIESIDIEEEIVSNRYSDSYKANFSLRNSLEDFEAWKEELLNLVSKIEKL